jgi:hypothetical protein
LSHRRTDEGFFSFFGLHGKSEFKGQMANGKNQMVYNLQFVQIAKPFAI